MKFTDLNENLTEAPGGFADRAKAKLQKKLAPGKEQRKRGAAKEKLYAKAKEIKNELKQWHDNKTGTAKITITMPEFLGWLQDNYPQFADTAEAFARGDKAYAEFFVSDIDKSGKETKTASDDKVKPRGSDQSEEEVRASYKKQGDELEAKRKAQGGELVDEDSDDEDSEPEVDMSASIYEARLREFLNEEESVEVGDDVGVNPSKTLADNQIDTIIVGGIRGFLSSPLKDKQAKGFGGPSSKKEVPSKDDEVSKAADKVSKAKAPEDDEELSVSSASSGGSSFDEYEDELEDILGTIAKGNDLSDSQKRQAKIIFRDIYY